MACTRWTSTWQNSSRVAGSPTKPHSRSATTSKTSTGFPAGDDGDHDMTTTFQYTVRDRAGKLVKGTISADSQTIVMQRLKAGGYAPVSITQANSGMKKEITIPGSARR